MFRTRHITLTAAAVASVAMFVADDAEARSFGGFSRSSFSRPAAFRAPQIRSIQSRAISPRIAPRNNFAATKPVVRSIKPKPVITQRPITNRITVPSKLAQLPKPIIPIVNKPIRPFDPGQLAGGLKPAIPPRIGPPTLVKQPLPLPPGLRPIIPPGLRPIDPGGNGAPPPKGTNPPPAGNYPPPPPTYGDIGPGIGSTVIGLVGATIGGTDEPAATVQVDCYGYYRKWEQTGDKYWKLTYYECTGQL